MSDLKPVVVNHKGMITIPANIRKKFNIKEGSEVVVLEIEGNITIIPIIDPEAMRIIPIHELIESYEESHAQELELEK